MKTLKKQLEEIFDDNANYFSSYTGTPMLMSDKVIPKIMALIEAKNLHKPNVSSSLLAEIRQAAADYVKSEGCSCCQDRDAHREASERLGKLLKVKKYSDGSGRDFYRYASKQ